MGEIARLLGNDPELAMLKLQLARSLREQFKDHPNRAHELHVSDFTASTKQFCYRTLASRFFRPTGDENRPSWVKYDGKWREEKWRKLFETRGILRAYQLDLKLGVLGGHPDFVVDFGHGDRIVELTGHDSKISPALLNMRVHVKQRQCLLYLLMYRKLVAPIERGYVIVEDKGNCSFKIIPVEWNDERGPALLRRVARMNRVIAMLSDGDPVRVWRALPRCGKKRCERCDQSWKEATASE